MCLWSTHIYDSKADGDEFMSYVLSIQVVKQMITTIHTFDTLHVVVWHLLPASWLQHVVYVYLNTTYLRKHKY